MTTATERLETLKDLKARMTVGARLEAIEHWIEKHRGKIRTIVKSQGNGYFYKNDGDDTRYWSEYPPRKQMAFHDDGSITFHAGEERFWRLRFV